MESPTTIRDPIEKLELRKSKIEQQITHNEGTIRERKAKIGTIEENIEKLQGETGTCPLCGQELSEAHRKEKLAEFKANIEAIEGTIAELRST
ncbi:MAG: hypothetical protein GWO20_13345, partial [Candidatus Korarchaeota archaeon]|nr:hypothetical protein [Candidatus Korarchaeota archaeon]